MLRCPPPRAGTTPTPDVATFGDDVARWHLAISQQHLLPWQRYVADVAGELDPATGLRRFDTVFVKVPRQQGKSWLLEAQMVAAAHRPGRRIVVYCAQGADMSSLRIVKELGEVKLPSVPVLRDRFVVRRARGQSWIEFADLSRIQAVASNDKAGHGLTVDDVVIDEAFSFKDLSIINALQPTTLTRPDPQLWIVSTPGDGDDALMLHYEDAAAAALNDPDTAMAVFDWSATEDDDRADPAVWARVMPALGHTIDTPRVRSLLATTAPAEFDRAYLARRPTASTTAALDLEAWHACRNPHPPLTPAGEVTVAVELDPERSHGVIAVACRTDRGVGVLVDRQPGTRWLTDAVMALAHRHGITVFDVWADRRSGLGGIIDELAGRGIKVHEVTAGDVASAAGLLYDLTVARELVHDDQLALTDAARGSRRRPLGDAWTFSKLDSTTDVAPLAAVALAAAAHRQHFPSGTTMMGIG